MFFAANSVKLFEGGWFPLLLAAAVAFLVGLAASVGAGISMGFAEALSDDGSLTGRDAPVVRGVVCGLMSAIGGLGHTLPYLVPDSLPNAFMIATAIARRSRSNCNGSA